MLLTRASSYQYTVQHSNAVPHAAALGLVVSMYSTVQHCCTTCCCFRPRTNVQYSTPLLHHMLLPRASSYQYRVQCSTAPPHAAASLETWVLCHWCIAQATPHSAAAHTYASQHASKLRPVSSTRPHRAVVRLEHGRVIGCR